MSQIEALEQEEIKPSNEPKEPNEAKRHSELAQKDAKRPVGLARRKSLLKKLDQETAKLLSSLNEKANKKTHGRRVRDSEILHLGLTLVESKHLDELKEKSLSEKDRLSLAHEEYQKQNGKLSLDQFIGKLLRGETALKN
ncbi:hypothetical protein ACLVWU_08745 [Bdellovibrio sp. HCB290]|uniref:hypothetical protein n=1 Tax=Bdellovibrio sp. HCB290 TaxID=3394356 RepID=UPI0039B371EF